MQSILSGQWKRMFGALSVVIVLAGAALAYASRISPSRRGFYEIWGGILLLTGLVLLGLTLPISY